MMLIKKKWMIIFNIILFLIACKKHEQISYQTKDAISDKFSDHFVLNEKFPQNFRDEKGLLLPSEDTPFGTPLPADMKKVTQGRAFVRYEGRWKVDDVIKFYSNYLKLEGLGAMEEKGRSYIFPRARPNLPGNPGNIVEVRIVDESYRGKVAVEIYDLSIFEKDKGTDWSKVPPLDPGKWKPSKRGEMPPDEFM